MKTELRKLLLDFGFPYKRHKLFYEEYLKPRGGAGLLDPLTMEMLPPLKGIYRTDIDEADLWRQLAAKPLYREIDHVDGVLLTHAHLDHSGHISFLQTRYTCICNFSNLVYCQSDTGFGEVRFRPAGLLL